MQYDPIVIPFVASILITTTLAGYAFRKTTRGARIFAAAMSLLSIWTLCYVLELSSVSLESKVFWLKAKYLGSATAPATWFLFSLYITNNEQRITRLVRLLVGASVLVTWLVVFTNDLHHWMWTTIEVVPGFPETQTGHGFFFWIYAAFCYFFIIASVAIYANYYRTAPPFFRKQALLLMVGGFVPLAGRMPEDFLGIHLVPRADTVVLFFLFLGIFVALALFRYDALNIVSIAHNVVVHNIRAGIIVVDSANRIVEINPYAQSLFGASREQAVGKQIKAVIPDWPDLETIGSPVEPDIRGAQDRIIEASEELIIPRDGKKHCFSIQRSEIFETNGTRAGEAIVLFDITKRKEAEMQLAHIARTDQLTGITNRRHFMELADTELIRAKRYERPLAVMLLDVDHFKVINDNYGHQAGDRVLQVVAARCKEALRSIDIFGRYGGEEFGGVLVESTEEEALEIAERVRALVASTPVQVEAASIEVSVSVGLAYHHPGDSQMLPELIRQADEALYLSKAGGRNMVTAWGRAFEQLLV